MRTKSVPLCQHIRTIGTRCGSPALQTRRFCYYHQAWRPGLVNLGEQEKPLLFVVPVLEDAHSIQFALAQTMQRLLAQVIDPKTAGLMFYGLQIASSNLKQMKPEIPQPDDVVENLDAIHQPQLEPPPLQDNHNANDGDSDSDGDKDKDNNKDKDKDNKSRHHTGKNQETTYIKPLLEPTYKPVEDARIDPGIQQGHAEKPVYNGWQKPE